MIFYFFFFVALCGKKISFYINYQLPALPPPLPFSITLGFDFILFFVYLFCFFGLCVFLQTSMGDIFAFLLLLINFFIFIFIFFFVS
jgi:hypothetical protein